MTPDIYLTVEEVRALILQERKKFKTWSAFARALQCPRPNLVRACAGKKGIPHQALDAVRVERVFAYRRKNGKG